jgi:hypothetical protein
VCRDKPAQCEGVQVSDSEGLASHAGPESGAGLGNGVREALTGERAGRVSSPEIGLVLGADALRTRGRQYRRPRFGEGETDPAGSETSAWTETRCAEPGRPCIWPGVVWSGPYVEPTGYARDARVQGVGQPHSIDEAPEQWSWCARAGGGGGEKGAGQGEPGRVPQGPDTEPGNPATGARLGTVGALHLRVITRGRSPVR